MDFNKVQYISFKSADEAVLIAKFLKGLGFKMDKKCFDKEYYVYPHYTYWWQFNDENMKYNGFVKIGHAEEGGDEKFSWRAIYDASPMFTYKAEGKKLIRKEKLKKLNQFSNEA